MGKQSSRMYGIKVKERVNYYEFGGNDGYITLYYVENLDIWQVKAGKHNQASASNIEWWYNGHSYNAGDTIESFNDGDIVTFHILESHTDTIPYINYIYDVFGNAAQNSQYGDKDVKYKIMPGSTTYSCKVSYVENGIIKSHKEFTSEDILQYKNSFSMLYPVYNIKFDWHGMDPSSGYPQMSFQAISDSNYIKYNGNTKSKGETIKTWQAIGFTGFEVTDDTNKYTVQNKSKDAIPSVQLCKRMGGSYICQASKSKETIFSDIFYDHKDVYYNGKHHKAMFLVYDNPGVADCWKKKLDGLAITYARPYWFLMTTRAGIEYNGVTYEAQKLIRSWSPSDSVNMTLKETISRTKEKVEVDIYDQFVYFISEQSGTDQIVIDYKQIVPTDDGEGDYYNDYRDVEVKTISSVDEQPVNYKKLKFELKNGTWTIYSKSAYIVFNGTTYKSGKALIAFPLQGAVDITVYDESDKYQTQYEHIVYDVEELENVDSVTVKKQIVTQVQDEEGHSHKEYVDLDTITFSSSSTTPIRFQNIEFRLTGTTWTIYSKCGYIKYNGRMYYNNRSILSFAVAEAIHIEIADESDKYEIKEAITYTVKTPDSDVTVGYSLHTSETALTMKIVKSSGDKEEPWVTVNFYEAIYKPFMYDDVSLMFDTKEMKWELYSNNDNLYYNGTNYKKGSKLGEWPYRQIVKIGNIIVTHENHNALLLSKTSLANGKLIKNEDVDEDIAWHDSESVDFHISYGYAKGTWTIKAVHDCWCDGIKYVEGQIIKQFKTKTYLEPFGILCQYQDDPESPVYTNVYYSLNVNITPDGVTAVTISSTGHNSVTYSDKDISHGQSVDLLFTKNDAKSMYGYIWERDDTPPVPAWDIFDFIVFRDDYWNTRYVRIKVENNELVWDHGTLLSWAGYAYSYGLGLFNNNYLNECYLGNTSNGYKITFNEFDEPILTSYNNFYKMQYEQYYTEMIGIINNGTSIAMKLVEENGQWYIYKYIANTTNDIITEEHILVGENYWDVSVTDDRNNLNTFLINNKLYFITHDSLYMTIFVADTSYTHMYNYGYENFVEPLETTISNIYPLGYGGYTLLDYAASFEHNGYIYQFISCYTGNNIYKPALIKINASNGTWQFVTLTNTDFYSDVPESDGDNPIIFIRVINSNNQIYLYVYYTYNFQYSTYIYRVEFTNEGIEINRRNSFIRGDHKYVSFKYGNEIARCYPQEYGDFQYDSNLGCYVFGTNGLNINRRDFVESNLWGDCTARYSGGLLGNIGKGNYIIGNYYGSSTTMFIAKLGSLDLTDSIENEVFTVGQFS